MHGDRERLLDALRYLMEHYEELWEEYEQGRHITRYAQLIRGLAI